MQNENNYEFPKIPLISKRLLAISKLITYDDIKNDIKKISLADIGTDHGYLPIYILLTNNNIQKIIASDINKNPLKSAEENVRKHGVTDKIELRLGGGFSKINKNEVDIATCSGMGGKLMIEIIKNDIEIVKNLNKMICQPQSDLNFFRKEIISLGFQITHEEMVYETGQFYNILLIKNIEFCENLDEELSYSEMEFELGRKNLECKSNVFMDYLQFKIDGFQKILNSIGEERGKSAKEIVKSKICLYKEVLENGN